MARSVPVRGADSWCEGDRRHGSQGRDGSDNSIPRERDTSPEFAELDSIARSRFWQVTCREKKIAEVDDFCEYLIGDQSIFVDDRTGKPSAPS